MRIVLQGKTDVNDVGNSILDALNQTMDIIDSENPDLIKELQDNINLMLAHILYYLVLLYLPLI